MNALKYLVLVAMAIGFQSKVDASVLQFSCTMYTQYYQTYNSGQISLASSIEGTASASSYGYPSLSAAERASVIQVENNYCMNWAQNYLNGLPTSVFPIGGYANVWGAGYLWVQNGLTGFNIVMPTQGIYKTSGPVSACMRLPYYKRIQCMGLE